jgi:uncharacterized Tic20 family protein
MSDEIKDPAPATATPGATASTAPDPTASAAPLAAETPELGVSGDAKTWGMFCHLAALSGYIGVPCAHIVGPLIIWQIKKNEHPFCDEQGKESLNFQITMTLAMILCVPLFLVIIGFFLIGIIALMDLILTIMAAVKAYNGVHYRYPFTIRFIK